MSGEINLTKPASIQQLIKAFDQYMHEENVPEDIRRRIVNRLVYGETDPGKTLPFPATVTLG